MRKVLKSLLIVLALVSIGTVIYKNTIPKMYSKAMVSKEVMTDAASSDPRTMEKAIVAQISPAQGIKVIIDDDTSWSATLQVLAILLGTYGGIKVINKYTRA